MNAVRYSLVALMIVAMAAPLVAGEIGDKAPALTIKEWVKGKPVDVTTADGKNIYVVEFWATWCGPCIQSIPHLSEMQAKYKDKNVTFIGVSTDGPRSIAEVKPFVEKQGKKMAYTVAIDKDGATSKSYMGAFGVNGIPHAFIVNQKGQIIWHDHPMGNFEEILGKVIAGKFDVAAAKKLVAKREEEQAEMMKLSMMLREYFQLAKSSGNDQKLAELGMTIYEKGKSNDRLMNHLAWEILTQEGIVDRDLKLALKAAEAANKATGSKSASVLDTYALALFENGKHKQAIKAQTKAVELAKKDSMGEQMIKELSERLERFKAEAE